MEFGPEINEDRPAWLDVSERVWVKWSEPDQWSGNKGMAAGPQMHSPWIAFRLPADHSYYKSTSTPTPDERAVAPELVSRLVELARSVATSPACTILQTVEAQGILAALEPVDGDLVEARKICDELLSSDGAFVNGEWDNSYIIRASHLAVARGRQLEKEGK